MDVAYSYWRNINNHSNSNFIYIFLTFYRSSGGAGPTLFSLDKTTDQITKIGPLFAPDSPYSWSTGMGWYFSASQPTKLYMNDRGKLLRYDVLSHQFELVFDVTRMYGADRAIQQMHSSNDDVYHSATLKVASTGEVIGCMFFREDIQQFTLFHKVGALDECNLDKSGQWLISLEQVDGLHGVDMRVFSTSQGTEIARVMDQDGAPGHLDMGYGYLVGADNWAGVPGAVRTWTFGSEMLKGPVDFTSHDWNMSPANHIAHENARPNVPMEQQFACGSNADTVSYAANEVVCFRLDGSKDTLVVAPIMTEMGASGGGANTYNKYPKGNLDVMGHYFIWTSNLGGNRLDAFLVKVPSQLLVGG